MTVTERLMGAGHWAVHLDRDTPPEDLDRLEAR